jgi:Protein of unknown function (DUF732)
MAHRSGEAVTRPRPGAEIAAALIRTLPLVDAKRRVTKGCKAGLGLIAAGLAALSATGCHSHTTATSDATDQQFLAAVFVAAPNIGSYRTDTQLIRIGHAACDGFRSHATYEQLADRLTLQQGNDPLPSEDLGAVITSAVEAFCPQFDNQVS